jgi:hypothetical protein
MDTSELRKRILRALDEAGKEAVARRQEVDAAGKAYETFLSATAVPLLRQAADVLKANRHSFSVQTPAAGPRLASDSSSNTFIELSLDTSGAASRVIGRTSFARGQRVVVEEQPLASGKPVAELTEDDVSSFLVTEIPKLVLRP